MPKRKRKVDKHGLSEDRIMSGALIAISVVALVQLLSVGQLDIPLKISLYCFAVSIPLLSLASLNRLAASAQEYIVDAWYDSFAIAFGSLASFVGVGALFWHFSRIMGGLFFAISFFGVIAYLRFYFELEKVNDKSP
jgi:hypothetical protein